MEAYKCDNCQQFFEGEPPLTVDLSVQWGLFGIEGRDPQFHSWNCLGIYAQHKAEKERERTR